ncbi:MAG: prepilin peptidase [Thaumarchaeota archaeon]|nr:prepilin peptidase [Candidatus Calditenuaceae archaeon]MDW8186635.1 prepilin peptidase [Nitrososphaerota archaeon]
MNPLELVNAAIASLMLAVASYMDLKRREVDDWVWMLLSSLTLPLTLYLCLLRWDTQYPLIVAASVALSSLLALIFYKFEFYGGADAKAVISLALALPASFYGNRFHPFYPITTLLNGLLVSLSVPVSLLTYNLVVRPVLRGEPVFAGLEGLPLHKRIGALFLGTRVDWPKTFWAKILLKNGERLSLSPPLENYFPNPLSGTPERTWATPGIPLIIFIALGHALNVLYGDLLFPVVTLLSR